MTDRRLDADLWARVEPVLDEVLELEAPRRPQRARELCYGDAELLAAVLRLLELDESGGDPLEEPLDERVRAILGADPEPSSDLPSVGTSVGPWTLCAVIGRGGMGTVFRAERADGGFEQTVALKLLSSPDPDGALARRMERERRILAPLEHPHIARLVDGGLTPSGLPWFAMEFVDGEPIPDWCARHGAGLALRLRLMEDACDAVSYAHQRLVVHRDLKPSNILVTRDGEVKLVDFGIAKILGGTAGVDLTRTGVRPMTLRYAAPEQIRGDGVTTATDVYGLGAVLYELLGGKPLFTDRSSTDRELEQAVLHASPAPLPDHVPLDVRRIVAMALRKEPGARYPSVEALAEDLRRLRHHQPVRARPATVGYRVRCYMRRHRAAATASSFVVLALLAGLATTVWQARIARHEAARARQVSDFLVGIFEDGAKAADTGHVPSARDLLDAGRTRLDRELVTDPQLRAELLLLLGKFHFELGSYSTAEIVLTDAVAEAELGYGSRSPEWAKAADLLGSYFLERGQIQLAEPLFEQVLEIALDHGDRMLEEQSSVYANLAAVHSRRGDREKAIELYRRALELGRRVASAQEADPGIDLNNLGVELQRADRTAEADSILTLALEVRTAALGTQHPDVAVSLHNLAAAKEDAGDTETALALYSQALTIHRATLPRGHPDIAWTLTSRGSLSRNLGRLDEAEADLREAVEIQQSIGGDPTYELARTLNSLGTLAYSRRDYAEAARWFELAADGFDKTVGPESPAALTTRNNYAVILHRHGDLERAREQMERVLQVRERIEGPESQSVGFSHKSLGMVALDMGDVDEAQRHLDRASELLAPHCAEEVQVCAEVRLGLGRCALAAGEVERADSLLRSSLADLERTLPADHDLVLANRRWLTEITHR